MNNKNMITNTALWDNMLPAIKENGKYGITLVVLAMTYDLAKQAIKQGYGLDFQIGKDKIDLKFIQPQAA